MKKNPPPAVPYRYRPVQFYLLVFGFTWLFWVAAALTKDNALAMGLMFLGLLVPPFIAVVFVLTSRSATLRRDFKRKLAGFARLRLWTLPVAVLGFGLIVAVSIVLSVPFGGRLSQFALSEGFSFSIRGSSALLTILLASVIEELGWRGYGEDAIASRYSWFRESLWFGAIWALWHLPLFWIPGTYHAGLAALGTGYVLNFLISVLTLGFLTTWVYVKNNRSMLASILFHLFVNFFQEKIAMTPKTKCIETAVIAVAAVVVVLVNRDLFFEQRHVGDLLGELAPKGPKV